MSFVVSCCSSVDIPVEQLKENNISYVPMHYSLDGEAFLDELETRAPMADFYKKMSEGALTATSQVNIDEYKKYFESFLAEGKDILHICLSSGITGTYNSALIAKEDLLEKYPDSKIVLVDSLCASCGYGILALRAAKMQREGCSVEETADYIEKLKHRVQQWFFSTDLSYYVRGGRLSAVSGWFGTVLKICPLLEVDGEGKLVPREKYRGKQKAITACAEKMKLLTENGSKYDGECYIANADCIDDAKALAAILEKEFPKLKNKIQIVDVGAIIGSHTGPGTTGLFFVGKEKL